MNIPGFSFGILAAVTTAAGGVAITSDAQVSLQIFGTSVVAVLSVGIWIGTKLTGLSKDMSVLSRDLTANNKRMDDLTDRLNKLPCSTHQPSCTNH